MAAVTGILNVLAANMVGSSLPANIAIGNDSTAFASGQTSLVSETDRNGITDNDLATGKQATFVANFSPTEISGITLEEFGTFTSGGTMLDRQLVAGGVVFDGTQELQIQETFSFSLSGA